MHSSINEIGPLDQILEAIAANAEVRPFDIFNTLLAATAVVVTVAIAVIVARGSKKQSDQAQLTTAMDYLTRRIEAIDPTPFLSQGADLELEFLLQTRNIHAGLGMVLGKTHADVAHLVQGEFNYTMNSRLGVSPISRHYLDQIVREMAGDVIRDVAAYSTSVEYRKTLRRYIAALETPYLIDGLDWLDYYNQSKIKPAN